MATTIRTQAALSAMAGVLLAAAALFALAGNAGEARALVNCDVGDFSNDAEELTFLTLINNYRAENGLGALTISTNLNRASHWMSNDLGVNAYFSHTDSLGRSPYQRALDCGYPQGAGENLAAGTAWDTAQEAFTAWQNSPGHNANMLGTYYRQIGIARVQVPGSPYNWYWTTNFGATDDGTGGGGAPTNTPAPTNTSVPPTATNTSAAPTATNTPVAPTATPTNPTGGGPTNTATTQPTATPTNTPAGGGGSNPLMPPTPPPPPSATPTASPPPTKTPTPKPTNTPGPTATATTPAGSLPLVPGSANLVGWPGEDQDPEVALQSISETIEVVYRWNPTAKKWERYGPDLPDYVNNLLKLRKGEAYWVITR
jgi:uncharacterized protein YkwD